MAAALPFDPTQEAWKASASYPEPVTDAFDLRDESGQLVAKVYQLAGEDDAAEATAGRAQLMASSPDLFRSLAELVHELTTHGLPSTHAMARATRALETAGTAA